MTFIFYDTETTGLNAAFDQIVQFAAIVTDDDFRVLEDLNLRCRLKPHVIASPGAMRVTKVGPRAIQSAPMSCYEMAGAIRSFIERWSPAILIGFNSISFDENMLRQAFFQALHPTYLTNTNGNSRMDVLRFAHAVFEHEPTAISVPLNDKGKPSFKLGALVAANGLVLGNAHDALADTRATLALAKVLRDRAPQIWDDLLACRTRHTVQELLRQHPLFLVTDRAFKKPTILAGAIVSHPKNPASVAVFDLEYDPDTYLDADQDALQRILKASPRPIRVMRTNALPLITPLRDQLHLAIDPTIAQERLDRIREHPFFAQSVAAAMEAFDSEFEDSGHVEQSIYGGFPTRGDQKVMDAFHKASWPERYALLGRFFDARYKELGERIVYADAPEALPEARRTALRAWHRDRHMGVGEYPWLTLTKAREELAALGDDTDQDFFVEIRDYLDEIEQAGSSSC